MDAKTYVNYSKAKDMQKSLDNLKKLVETNRPLAEKIAKESLMNTNIIDEDKNVLPPYNGTKVNDDDFTRGPGEITYVKEKR